MSVIILLAAFGLATIGLYDKNIAPTNTTTSLHISPHISRFAGYYNDLSMSGDLPATTNLDHLSIMDIIGMTILWIGASRPMIHLISIVGMGSRIAAINMPAEGAIAAAPLFHSVDTNGALRFTITSLLLVNESLYFRAGLGTSGTCFIGKVLTNTSYSVIAGSDGINSCGVSAGDDAAATAATISGVCGGFGCYGNSMATDGKDIYFSDNTLAEQYNAQHQIVNTLSWTRAATAIRKISLSTGMISRFSGLYSSLGTNPTPAEISSIPRGDGGPLLSAVFLDISAGVVVDTTRRILYTYDMPIGGAGPPFFHPYPSYLYISGRLRAIDLRTSTISTICCTGSTSDLMYGNYWRYLAQNFVVGGNGPSNILPRFSSMLITSNGSVLLGQVDGDIIFSYSPDSLGLKVFRSDSSLFSAPGGSSYEGSNGLIAKMSGNLFAIDSADNMYFSSITSQYFQMISNSTKILTTVGGSYTTPTQTCSILAAPYSYATSCSFSIMTNMLSYHPEQYQSTLVVNANGTMFWIANGLSRIFFGQPYRGNAFFTPSLFRAIPRMDVVGTLVGNQYFPGQPLLYPQTEAACQLACFNTLCDGYTFNPGAAATLSNLASVATIPGNPSLITGTCYLFTNITQFVPNNFALSGVRANL